jgi:glycosyltransferase involved in cell wall biosynthesis
MAKKALTVSIIIPVYNEEGYIGQCLDTIAAQTSDPTEVIVIDNNSTDATVSIAARYPFVTLLHEKRQGQVYAQALGFNKAKGNILARIDADTHLPKDWVHQVQVAMAPDEIVAVTGTGEPYDVPLKYLALAVFYLYHHRLSRLFAGHTVLWGSNFAMRRSIWKQVKDGVHYQRNIWEDYDLSFHLAPLGRIQYLSNMKVRCSFRAGHRPLKQQLEYQYRCIRTFSLHYGRTRVALLFLAWSSMLLVAPMALIDRYLWLAKNFVTQSTRAILRR